MFFSESQHELNAFDAAVKHHRQEQLKSLWLIVGGVVNIFQMESSSSFAFNRTSAM